MNLGGAHLDKLGLYPIQQPFDMITMLGFLVLIGTVVNNPFLIVERAVSNLRKRSMDVLEAVTELYRGLGAIVLFGLLFSTLVILTFMPALLFLILQLAVRFRKSK